MTAWAYACIPQVNETECGISQNVTKTAALDQFAEGKNCGDCQNDALVMDSQTEDFYKDPRYWIGTRKLAF